MFKPGYLELYRSGELFNRIANARDLLKECTLCPRQCLARRLEGETGTCRVGSKPIVSSYGPHFGEERPLVGYYGSGTIFFTYCNLNCLYCQNYTISHEGDGEEVDASKLAAMMLYLQRQGCHNINFVTPTHQVPQILEALPIAIEGGLEVPLVYNCGGYEAVETLRLLEGVFDIYMPDFKYGDPEPAARYSKARDYPEVARAAFKEMHRQVGDLVINEKGIAQRGLLVRHLVLPEDQAGTEKVMRFLAEEVSRDTYVNVMDQYRPCYKAYQYPLISRRPTASEYQRAVKAALDACLWRLDGVVPGTARARFIIL